MVIERDPSRQCAGKNTYGSKREAKRALRVTQTSLGRDALGYDPLVAYRCPHGDHFHFGHVSPELKAEIRRQNEEEL